MTLEESFKAGTDDFGFRTLYRAQLEDEATVFVAHGEWFDLTALAVTPMPLEVHAPNGIGFVSHLAVVDAAALAVAPQAPVDGEAGFVQDALEAAFAGHLVMLALVKHADLLRSPMLMRQLERDDLADHRLAQLLGMTAGTAAGLGQAS